ncbi:MAG: transglutaminase domain-containing protein [Pseudoflavonifractor sp.]|nr:transglutaminase domain-containing protein [Alloprevotella sp.]MCM1116492.1 transglutaminase domain-containing protein [Pseudoflavonifractor sp.]
MKNLQFPLLAIIISLLSACTTSGNHSQVKADFEARRQALAATGIFAPLDTLAMTDAEREAMEFLYAYSPLPDIADRTPDFMLANVRMALKAREEMEWTVPDREWTYFVLPTRVNNEPLDSARIILYDELSQRVKGLSMADAILEVNHWAHEKATYQPSDGRTRSPLQTLRAAIGRCGEESTFLVAALRTIGIPARQVYTPRWAHTDDNHAWVEAWADGKWHFLGACEPEPVLDLGWFNAPASRGMLMSTRVFGRYDGPEEQLDYGDGYTIINVTDNYAPTRSLRVVVTDTTGAPVEGATVRYGLYNYAEFYPLAELTTGDDGATSLRTGLGDILVWASDGRDYALTKASAGDTIVSLTPSPATRLVPGDALELDLTVPAESTSLPDVTPEQRATNDRRFTAEDSMRTAYMASAFLPDSAIELLPEPLRPLARNMRSNHCLLGLFAETGRPDCDVMALLNAISAKDLGDAPYPLLLSALLRPYADIENVINPRISTEELTPWWVELDGIADSVTAAAFRANPSLLAKFVADSIAVTESQWQPANLLMSPGATWRTRLTSAPSRDIFFVAAARTLGIPARLNTVTSVPQYLDGKGQWVDAILAPAARDRHATRSRLALSYDDPTGLLPDPQYYTHFTLSAIDSDGLPSLLTYDEGTSSAKTTFASPGAEIALGNYLLTSGRRLANGNVLARIEAIRVDSTGSEMPLIVRSSSDEVEVIGSFNSEDRFIPEGTTAMVSILSQTGRGYFIIGLMDGSEPSIHALNDLAAVKEGLEANGIKIILLTPSSVPSIRRQPSTGTLPSTVIHGQDPTGAIAKEIINGMNIADGPGYLPVFIIADTFNRVVFLSSGYTIGLGQRILDTLGRI